MLLPPGELSIELEDHERCYAPGDTVRGSVFVDTDGGFTCRALTLRCGWKVEGSSEDESAVVSSQELAAGTFEKGRREFPFAIELPGAAPPTYRGDSVRLEWRLEATLDVQLSVNAQSSEAIVVTRRPRVARSAQMAEFVGLPKNEQVEVHVGPVHDRAGATFARGAPFGCVAFVARTQLLDKVVAALVARESTSKLVSSADGTSKLETESRDVVFARGTARTVYKRMPRNATPYREVPGADEEDAFASAPPAPDNQNEFRMLVQIPDDAPATFSTERSGLRWFVRVTGYFEKQRVFDETHEIAELV